MSRAPLPTATTYSQPPCTVSTEDLWFSTSQEDAERAVALCRRCPLMIQCREEALRRGEPWGVWGGAIFLGGVIVDRRPPRGRPRKDSAPAT